MRTAATIRTTVKLAVSALAVAAAGMTLAPLSALAATAPAGTSVSFTVLAPAVTSNGRRRRPYRYPDCANGHLLHSLGRNAP